MIEQLLKLAYLDYEPLRIIRKLCYLNIGKIMEFMEFKGSVVIAKNGIR